METTVMEQHKKGIDVTRDLTLFANKCRNNLVNDDQRYTDVVNYLMGRGMTVESIMTHKIGYCPKFTKIPDSIRFFNQDISNIENIDTTELKNYTYFIQDKIIVPIYSEFNTITAFATRPPYSGKDFTWWNLPFTKGEYLYLLNVSRKAIFDSNKVYLVEGYMDAIILYQYGLTNVCCLMGTVLTPRRIGLLARYCNNICFALDFDKNGSGQRARDRAIFELKECGFCENISHITLPEGIDPDAFVINNGLAAFKNLESHYTESQINEICDRVRKEMK